MQSLAKIGMVVLHEYGTESQAQTQEPGHSGHRGHRGGGHEGPRHWRPWRYAESAVSLPSKDGVDLLKQLRKLLTIAISLLSGIKQFRHHPPSPT